jgi:type I restriction enzyme S subunit
VTGWHAESKVAPPGVVIGRYGSLGSVHWVTKPFWPLNTSLWVKDFSGNDERFVSYLLKTVSVDGSTASAVPGVNRNHLHRLPVRRPPVDAQRRIAAVLSAFDELIEINERRIEVLEALARSLYREWFVRFRFPGHAEVDFTDSELGPIPERWEVVRLGSTAKWFSGGTPSTTEPAFWDGDIPWISSGSLKSMLLDRSDRSVTPAGASVGSRIVERDTLLFVVRGMSLAREFRVGVAERTLAFGQDCKALLANDGVEPLYLAFSVFERRDDIQGMVELAGHGTGKLSTDRLKAVKYPLPPEPVQRAFVETVTPIREALATHAVRSRQLAATRDLLLPRLVTGRLNISDIDLGELLPAEAA